MFLKNVNNDLSNFNEDGILTPIMYSRRMATSDHRYGKLDQNIAEEIKI